MAIAAGAAIIGGLGLASASKGAKASKSAASGQSEAAIRVAEINAASAETMAAATIEAGYMNAGSRADAARISAASMTESARISADAARESSAAQIAYQEKGLKYLIDSEKLPMQYRDQALGVLGDLYGMAPGEDASASAFFDSPLAQRLEIDQGELVARAQQSPMYAAMMGTRKAGEEAILRNASATGGLRSGNVQENLYDYNVQLGKESLMSAYGLTYGEELAEQANVLNMVSGLSGMAGQQGNAPQVAGMYSAMGQTAGQGIWNAGQATAGGVQGAGSAIAGGVQGAGAIRAGAMTNSANYIMQAANARGQGILGSANALAGGQIGAANAWQQGFQNIGNMGMMGLGAYLQLGKV